MKRALLALATSSMLVSSAFAAPIQWTAASGGNDHWYEWIAAPADWSAARTAALSSSFNGQSGYLATITSAAENFFVGTTIAQGAEIFVGGSDAAVEGEWRWVDGPEAGALFGFTNWKQGEPNNEGGEHVMHINYEVALGWNDIPANRMYGYVVEYSAAPSVIPSPATLTLVLPALLAAGWASRRR